MKMKTIEDVRVHGREPNANEWHAAPARKPTTRNGESPLQGSGMPADGCIAIGQLRRPRRSVYQDGRAQAPRVRGRASVAPVMGESTSAGQ